MRALVFAAALLAVPAGAELSRDDVKKVLDKHPDLVLEVLKQNKKQVFDIVIAAQQEVQAQRQKEEEESEKREFEEAFKNPKKPTFPDAARFRGKPKKKAKYTLVEYSDFQCPYCKRGAAVVDELLKKYPNDMRFIFKNLPLNFHPQAMPAAQWFEAAALQSPEKAWEFHDKLFAGQDKLGEAFYKEVAESLGLDVKKLESDAKSQKIADKIEADVKEAHSFGFTGTPGYLLNGVPIRGAYPIGKFEEIIKRLDAAGN